MIDLNQYGYTQGAAQIPDGCLPARITEVRRDRYRAVCERGEVAAVLTGAFQHAAKGRSEYPAVGDFVLIRYNDSGDSGIVQLLERRSKFSRTDFSGHAANFVKTVLEQVVAANFDYVFIVSSLNQDFSSSRILRYLTQAWQGGGTPVVILTKADLVDDYSSQVLEVEALGGGVPVIPISTVTGEGLEALEPYLQPGKTIVFLGMSGVGKSSLLNALAGEQLMAVNGIRESDSRGRHTTTHRQLVVLPSGAMIIDTPGMRELGLWDAKEGLKTSFGNIEHLATACRFSDCTHANEPGCEIREALADGRLDENQWKEYQTQRREAAFVGSKSDYLRQKHSAERATAIGLRKRH